MKANKRPYCGSINIDRMKSSNVEEVGIVAWNKINL